MASDTFFAGMPRGQLVGGGDYEMSNSGRGVVLQRANHCYQGGKIYNLASVSGMVGIDDVGLFALCNKSAVQELQKSSNGITDFSLVLAPADGLRGEHLSSRQLIDCGRHTISGTEKRVLLFTEYPNAATATGEFHSRVWVSAEAVDADAGNAGTWTLLFGEGVECGAIRHWHGGIYVKNKGLYLFTGDAGSAASILFCAEADMGTFLASPATWYAADHWALENAAARSGWAENFKSAHVLFGNSQNARTVELVTADSRVGYYIPDREPVQTGFTSQDLLKVDFYDTTDSAAGTVSVLRSGLTSVGWFGGIDKRGTVYLSTYIKRNAENTGWLGEGYSNSLDVYAIDSESESFQKIKSYAPKILAAGRVYGLDEPLNEYGGAVFSALTGMSAIEAGDSWSDRPVMCGFVLRQKRFADNILTNGRFTSPFSSGWATGSSTNVLCIDQGLAAGIAIGDTVTGNTSGATGVVSSAEIYACTFTAEADDDVLTLPAAFFADGDPVRVVAGVGSGLPAGIASGTTYYVRDAVGVTIKLAATLGGDAINLNSDGSGAYCLIRKYTGVAATDNAANFASNRAVGWVRLSSCTGVFAKADEKLHVGGTERANLIGFMTYEVIADPTGRIGGNVLRVVSKSLNYQYQPYIAPSLSAAQKAAIAGGMICFSCKAYVAAESDVDADASTVQPAMYLYPTYASVVSYQTRFGQSILTKGAWGTWYVSGYIPTTATSHLYYFHPNLKTSAGAFVVYYLTDFQIITNSIPNDQIKQIETGRPGAFGNRNTTSFGE